MNTETVECQNSIDWPLSIKLANNNKELAKDLLHMFVNELPKASESIHSAHNQEKHTELLNEVHRLHGASCYCGVAKLKTILAEMEFSLKERIVNQFEISLKKFDEEVSNILDAFKATEFN